LTTGRNDIHSIFFIFCILLFIVPTIAQESDLPFDLNINTEQMHHQYGYTELRDGEFLIDTSIVYVSIPARYWYPSVSFDGSNYFIVWSDSRSGSYGIYGARVSQSGVVLDPASIAISMRGGNPEIAFDGLNYLVVWDDGDIYGARISQSGTIIDTAEIIISADALGERNPSVAFDGTNYFVIWGKYMGNYPDLYMRVYGARVDTSGTVLDPSGILIGGGYGWFGDLSVAYGDTTYLVVYQDEYEQFYYTVLGTRLNLNGEVLDSIPIMISWWTMGMEQLYPDVAFDGTNYLVAWIVGRNLLGKRINEAGQVLDSIPIDIPSVAYWPNPAVAFDSFNYLVVSNGIVGARVDTAGVIIDTTEIGISNSGVYPSIVFGDTNYFVAWQYDYLASDIFGARVNTSVAVLDSPGIDISNAANCQSEPSIGFNDINYLVAWQDYRNESWDIYAQMVDTLGAPIDTSIAVSTKEDSQINPSVTGGYPNYLIVWESLGSDSSWDVFGARVDQAGFVLDTAAIPIAIDAYFQKHPAAAFDGANYLVVWEDSNSYYPDIYGVRIDTSGALLGQIAISTASREQLTPTVAFDGTNYFVVWRDARSGNDWNIYGSRVDISGVVLDTGIAITSAVGWQYSPDVACGGANYLAVWEDDRNGLDVPDIYGARIDTSGVVLDSSGIPIAVAHGQQRHPMVTFDGTNYLVVWQDFRSDSTWDIHAAKVSISGEVLNTYVVCTQSGNQFGPALTKGNNNHILVTYSGWTDSINNRPANTMRIWGISYPFIGIEENVGSMIHSTEPNLCIYPNPFHKGCNIEYTLPQETNVNISLYDVIGRLIKEITNKNLNTGVYHKTFDMSDLAQGVYFIRLQTDEHSEVKKVIFIK
jgi:hypothetical protein